MRVLRNVKYPPARILSEYAPFYFRTMKTPIIVLLTLFCSISLSGQIKLKKPTIKKPKKLNLMEGIGNMTGNLMTGKTDMLDNVVLKVNYVSGMYSQDIKTTEGKYIPETVSEGDHLVYVSCFKNEGTGLLQLKGGSVKLNGLEMTYHGLGSYGYYFDVKPTEPLQLEIQASGGDEASFKLTPTQDIEIISVNDETALPILDLAEDLKVTYYNPPGTEGTTVRVSLLTKVMGVRAFNHFADFKVSKTGNTTVTIPKEALANPEIAGQLNVGNFDKGENYLILEREVKTEKRDFDESQQPGDVAAVELFARNYASFPVIVKGKQDDGLMVSLKVRAKTEDKTLGYEFYKPNANTGIPLSKASKFGLVSFTMEARTFSQETDESSRSWTVGNTKYTQTTVTTTTLDFPELPERHWEYAMDNIYNQVVAFFKSEYNVEFVPVEDVTNTTDYNTLFPPKEKATNKVIKKSYRDTRRTRPSSFSEIFGGASSNFTTDNPQVNMMIEAGELDGLVSMHMTLTIAANSENNIVLIPSLSISVAGRDEDRDNKQGKYLDGFVRRTVGEPYNEAALVGNEEELVRVCSVPQMIYALKAGINTLRVKEVEMGYDKIWSIGEE